MLKLTLHGWCARTLSGLKPKRPSKRKPFSQTAGSPALVELLENRQLFSVASVELLDVEAAKAYTGEKPQSKVWQHADNWWSVFSKTDGQYLWRLDGNNWTPLRKLSSLSAYNGIADVYVDGDVAHILFAADSQSELVSLQYNSAGLGSYDPWSVRPTTTFVALEKALTATIDVDSTGRMWTAYAEYGSVQVRFSDAPYNTFSAPITLETGVQRIDDIAHVTALPNGTVGVVWSNQEAQRFGFRLHRDGDDPTVWGANEVPGARNAVNVGAGMADNHLNTAVADDGTLFLVIKTSYSGLQPGLPDIGLLKRHPNGVWSDLVFIDGDATRPIVELSANDDNLLVLFRKKPTGVVYRECVASTMVCGPLTDLFPFGELVNDVSGMKKNYTDELIVIASHETSGAVYGARFTFVQPNLPPVAADDAYVVTEDHPLSVAADNGLLRNDTDTEGDPVQAELASRPSHGRLMLNGDGSFLYVPNANFFGTDTFTYRATDASGSSDATTVRIDVTPVNDPPVAESWTIFAEEGTDTPITLTAFEAEGERLTFSIVDGPAHGILTGTAPNVTYQPNAGFIGTDSFRFQARDAAAMTSSATVTINVVERNVAPDVRPASFSLPENRDRGTVVGTVAAGDDNSGQTLTYRISDGNTLNAFAINPSNGEITVTNSAALDFEAVPQFNLTVTVTDNGPNTLSDSATVTIDVTNVNEPPELVANLGLTLMPGAAALVTPAMLNAVDPDHAASDVRYTLTEVPGFGTLLLGDAALAAGDQFTQQDVHERRVSYVADRQNYRNQDFRFTVSDPLDGAGGEAAFQITIHQPLTFYVPDDRARAAFHYDETYGSFGPLGLHPGNASPKGAAAAADGSLTWIIDRNRQVYTYDGDFQFVEAWSPIGLKKPAGIASDGATFWIVDGKDLLVYRDQTNPPQRIPLAKENVIPRGIATDGRSLWVVDDSLDAVFTYAVPGPDAGSLELLGRWSLNMQLNRMPAGIMIDPTGQTGRVFVTDSRTHNVCVYENGATERMGMPISACHPLASHNVSPQGIVGRIGGAPTPKFSLSDASTIEGDAGATTVRFAVTLSMPVNHPVSVSVATADGTALGCDPAVMTAECDYASLPLTSIEFAPNQTTATVEVGVFGDDVDEDVAENFSVILSNTTLGTEVSRQATGTILDDDPDPPGPKFLVVDDVADRVFGYDESAHPTGSDVLGAANMSPRDVAVNADGSRRWVVDRNKQVYVYDNTGRAIGSWVPGNVRMPEGIASDGTDIWIAERGTVHYYAGAADRTSEAQAPTVSFPLPRELRAPKGITTDGTTLWIVDDQIDSVFVFDVADRSQMRHAGTWKLDTRNRKPTGITIDPSGGTHDLWIVDGDRRAPAIFKYCDASPVTIGNLQACDVQALEPLNKTPQGIAMLATVSKP